MRKYSKNKKIVSLMVSFFATTLILTGTFAWSVRLFSTTGGLGEDYYYLVKLLDIDTEPLFVINKWEDEKLNKKVYATSSYNVADIKTQYNDIIAKDSNAIFRDTWVRIKLEESFMRNGSTKTDIVTELNNGKLISSFNTYFSLDSNDVEIITLDTWVDNQETPDYDMHGRFWILDTESGWLYWAQPLLATTELEDSDSEIENQTTDHIIDEVSLVNQPAGVWEYTIKATLEAMDVELQGYEEEGAWNDIGYDHPIYSLIENEEMESIVLTIDDESFPDEVFRTWVINHVVGAEDGTMTRKELNAVTSLDISNQSFKDVTGLENFVNLQSLNVSGNQLSYLNVTNLMKLNKTDETTFKYNPQYRADNITTLIQTNDLENIKEWHIPEFDGSGNLLINAHNFPCPNFLTYVKKLTGAADLKFTPAELNAITSIDVSSLSIRSLIGIEHFKNLQSLTAAINEIPWIDVSKNTNLLTLRLGSNQITKIDVSKNTKLTALNVGDNYLTTIDLSKNTAITDLQLQGNLLSKIDLTYNKALEQLRILDNCLTEIDLTYNTKLNLIRIEKNCLRYLDVTKLTNLPKTPGHVSFQYKVQYATSEKNQQLTLINDSTNIKQWN